MKITLKDMLFPNKNHVRLINFLSEAFRLIIDYFLKRSIALERKLSKIITIH